MAIQRIIVDLNLIDRKIQSFQSKLANLKRLMEAISTAIDVLAAVAWLSPASRMLLQQFRKLYIQVVEAIKIVEEYIHDLTVVRTKYGDIENVIEGRMQGLRTDVFGV